MNILDKIDALLHENTKHTFWPKKKIVSERAAVDPLGILTWDSGDYVLSAYLADIPGGYGGSKFKNTAFFMFGGLLSADLDHEDDYFWYTAKHGHHSSWRYVEELEHIESMPSNQFSSAINTLTRFFEKSMRDFSKNNYFKNTNAIAICAGENSQQAKSFATNSKVLAVLKSYGFTGTPYEDTAEGVKVWVVSK